ncbi:MAG: AbrB/MazE/SpoVT family DNA-binding domain-containing protein [Thermoproteota archaeon]
MEVVKVDKKGRLLIPKNIRKKVGVREGSYVRIEAREKSIVIEPIEPVADKYFGAFKVEKWPEDLDEFVAEVMKNWWSQKAT